MSYRSDLDALAARHTALDNELAAKTKELHEASRQLEDAKARARLPVLDNMRIARPCTADWKKMTGDDRVRSCDACAKQVFDLSALTRAQAEALIVERNGELCATYYQRKDGTILLADCEIGATGIFKRRLITAGAAVMIAGTAALALTRHRDPAEDSVSVSAPPEVAAEHVAGATREAPPPKPKAQPKPQPPKIEQFRMVGVMAIRHDLDKDLLDK